MHILIVEDKRASPRTWGALWNAKGTRFHLHTMAKALRLGRTAAYDLLLLDVMFPGIDGFDVIKMLRGDRGIRQSWYRRVIRWKT